MMFTFLFAILLRTALAEEFIPALLWESGGNSIWKSLPGLQKVSTEKFKDLIFANTANRDLLLLFAEENLSLEDFSWHDDLGFNSFTKLDNITSNAPLSSHFIPAVENPMEALLALDQQWEELTLTADLPNLLTSKKSNSRLLVHLDDASDSEDRPDMLRRHDILISDAIMAAKESFDKVLIIYTGYHSSWVPVDESIRRVRSLLAAEEPPTNDTLFINADDKAFFYSSENIILTIDEISIELSNFRNASVEELEESNSLKMIIQYDKVPDTYTMTLNFIETTAGYWKLPDLTVSNGDTTYTLTTKEEIVAPLRFSYHCSQDVIFNTTDGEKKVQMIIKDLQVQPFPPEIGRFSDAYDCIWFFTVPIWSGLAVTILLLVILTSGLCMIVDIKTMDRFDDPKGKTITITATD